jgi:hypothetical protein
MPPRPALADWIARLRARLAAPAAPAARAATDHMHLDANAVPADPVQRVVHGLPVVVTNTRPDIDTEHVFRRVGEVLAFVEAHQPWRFRRLRRDLARIDVRRFPCRAAFFPAERACLLELTFVVNPQFNLAQVASSLVHEGVHARVHAMGVQDFPGRMGKEERLCRRAELDFGRAVPGGEPVVERALATLAMADEEVAPTVDWGLAARRVADADRAARGTGG